MDEIVTRKYIIERLSGFNDPTRAIKDENRIWYHKGLGRKKYDECYYQLRTKFIDTLKETIKQETRYREILKYYKGEENLKNKVREQDVDLFFDNLDIVFADSDYDVLIDSRYKANSMIRTEINSMYSILDNRVAGINDELHLLNIDNFINEFNYMNSKEVLSNLKDLLEIELEYLKVINYNRAIIEQNESINEINSLNKEIEYSKEINCHLINKVIKFLDSGIGIKNLIELRNLSVESLRDKMKKYEEKNINKNRR